MKSKALGIEGIVGEPVQSFLLHPLAVPAVDAADIELKVDARTSAWKIPHSAKFAVIPTALGATTVTARRFFERRVSVMTRAPGSPNSPRTLRDG